MVGVTKCQCLGIFNNFVYNYFVHFYFFITSQQTTFNSGQPNTLGMIQPLGSDTLFQTHNILKTVNTARKKQKCVFTGKSVTNIVLYRIKSSEYHQLVGNLPEVVEMHEKLLASLEDIATKPAADQRVGHLFLSTAPRLKHVHMTYCSSHPKAVVILDKYK